MVTFPMAPIYHKKCCICGKRILGGYNHTEYCPTCSRFAIRMAAKKLPGKTVESIWGYVRQYGYVCYYTGMPLDMTDPHSPWYCVFDHWIPNNDKKVVITSSLINDMKSDLSEKEFWYYIEQLYNYKKKRTPVKKKKPVYWNRLIADN